jgi:phosphoenolpyruvate phosphomutase
MTHAEAFPNTTDKCRALRGIIESPQLQFIMEAHNGLSARIVEQAGFKGIWASGLALSAQFGVRDNNEASWTQVVDMLEFMSDATHIPILLDGDTGYGNFNNMRRLVRKLEQRGVGGVCIEDKLFPKTNSFIDGERQPLADIDEFCGKIKAGKDSQGNEDFCIVARVEALIAGWGIDEALRRAEAYRAAGADAILIHSRQKTPDEVLEFARRWQRRAPLVIVPTKYYSTPTDIFRASGISLIIWANHMIRASISAMQQAAAEVRERESLIAIEDRIAPVDEVFRLQGAEELRMAEKQYFSVNRSHTRAIVLAASRGDELAQLTDERPKVMLKIGGKTLLRRLSDQLKAQDIHDISVVAGYKAETIDEPGLKTIVNPNYEHGGELGSLLCARESLEGDMVIMYGDLLFRSYVLRDLLESPGDIVVVVDSASQTTISGSPDYAYCSAPDDRSLIGQQIRLISISDIGDKQECAANGRWIGMLKVSGEGAEWMRAALDELKTRGDFNRMGVPQLLNYLVDKGRVVNVFYINGHWLDVNALSDLDRAGEFTSGQ